MESSSSRATIGVIGPSQCLLLREQAKELGVDFFDLDHLRAFNKNWKQIKKWGNLPDLIIINIIPSSSSVRC